MTCYLISHGQDVDKKPVEPPESFVSAQIERTKLSLKFILFLCYLCLIRLFFKEKVLVSQKYYNGVKRVFFRNISF